MKTKKLKRLTAGLLTFSLALGVAGGLETETEACTGTLNGNNGVGYDIKLYVYPSAQNSVLTMDNVYNPIETVAASWNGFTVSGLTGTRTIRTITVVLSPFANVKVYGESFEPYLMPNGTQKFLGGFVNDGPLDLTWDKMDSNWTNISIYMNTHPGAWGGSGTLLSTQQHIAMATFRHEVGHVLKLCHPVCNSKALMHQGLPYASSNASDKMEFHDIISLINKWGY